MRKRSQYTSQKEKRTPDYYQPSVSGLAVVYRVIYFQPKGFDIPVHRKATIAGLTESQIDGKRAFILVDPIDPDDSPSRDWVRQSSLQPYSDALWDALDRWVEQQRAHEEAHLQLRKGKIPPALAMASLF